MTTEPQPQPEEPTSPASLPPPCATVAFDDIAAGHREVVIEFRGQQYRLRATRSGKLILNK